ncbi:hypothetical protein EO244_12300 [Ancylomarina salipaludis]|uniref:Uncharacterized protein n=1 Tax=Ancylomarina salipaludis TaxID=2501299 RepID=A0A4V1MZY1_9BACT|nr:hypothetical protein [Ancylomarina salipaludis]RXQ91524.1 hypothetical protein EO244_12300 [Ancylomarina salipaludis]
MKKLVLIFGMVGILLSSCSNDDYFDENVNVLKKSNTPKNVLSAKDKEENLVTFAKILSKATYERKDVREFLKTESLKQFDKNYDVLYFLIKDEIINGRSFKDILISYSSEEIMEEIETNIPLLNILIPEIMFFNINSENLNTEDKEIPVVVSQESETTLFLNGKKELSLQKGDVPDFHVFVVNENSRVVAPVAETGNVKSGANKSITFKSPNFDGSLQNQSRIKSVDSHITIVGGKALEAYNYFNKDDGSIYQKAFQRDYVYYGITPLNQTGSLNRSVSEYLSFIEINPKTYFRVANQTSTGTNSDDPVIKDYTTSQEKRTLSSEELLDRMWTKGAYEFRFEVITSKNQHPQIIYVPFKPNEIWNFNITHTYEHSTFFRHSKNTYKIDPNNFTSKPVYLGADEISLGSWHLSEESLYRYINIVEEDESVNITSTKTYEFSHVLTCKFNGDYKLEVGVGKAKVSEGISAEVTSTNTTKESKTVVTVRKEGSDALGSIKIYYYNPIVDQRFTYQACSMPIYNTGYVKFGLTVK